MKKIKNAHKQGKALNMINRPQLKKSHLGWVIVSALAVGMTVSPAADAAKGVKVVHHTFSETLDSSDITEQQNYTLSPSVSESAEIVEPQFDLIATKPITSITKPAAPKFNDNSFETAYNKTDKNSRGIFGDVKWYVNNGVLHIGEGTFANNEVASSPFVVLAETKADKLVKETTNALDDKSAKESDSLLDKITSIKFEGAVNGAENSQFLFAGMKNLTTIDGFDNFNTKNVKNFGNMFANDAKVAKLDLSNFDTTSATIMSKMFDQMTSLKEVVFSTKFAPKQSVIGMETNLAVLPNASENLSWRAIGEGTADEPKGTALISPILGLNDVKLTDDTYVLTDKVSDKEVANTLQFVDKTAKQIGDDIKLTGKVGDFKTFGDEIKIPTGYVSTVSGVKMQKDGSVSKVKLTKEEDQIHNNLKFIDEDGKQVGEPKLIAGEKGDIVDVTQWLPTGYVFASEDQAKVTMGEDNTDLEVKVKKEAATEIENTVIFELEDGTKVGEVVTVKGKVGDQINVTMYDGKSIVPTGYELLNEATDKLVTIDEKNKEHVIKVKEANTDIDVIVNFVDKDGNKIVDENGDDTSITITGKNGEVVDISGYLPNGYKSDTRTVVLDSEKKEVDVVVTKTSTDAGTGVKTTGETPSTHTSGEGAAASEEDGSLASTGMMKQDRSILKAGLALAIAAISITGLIKLSRREIK